MAPNQSLTMDVSSFGDALHRDLYVRDTYQTSSNAILNEYFHLQGTTATAIAAKQVQLSGTEGLISLFTAPDSAELDVGVHTPVMTMTLSETNINSTVVNFAGTGIHLTSEDASFTNAGDTQLTGTFDVTGASSLSTLAVSSSATVGGTLGVTSTATFGSDVDVTGAATLGSSLAVTGPTTLSSTLGVTSSATFGHTLEATGATTLLSTLDVTSAATFSDTVHVVGAATLDSTLGVTGATALGSSLTVTDSSHFIGVVTADSDVTLTGTSSTFTNAGSTVLEGTATIGGTLGVTSSVTFGDTLSVAGATNLESTLDVTGASTFDSTSQFVGTATMDSDVTFTGTSSTFRVGGNTILDGPLTINSTLSVAGALGFSGDLDMSQNDILNVATVSRGSDMTLAFDDGSTSIKSYIGTAAIFEVTASGINVNGNFNISGQTTEIQSATVKVQDKNIELAYQAESLSLCDGAGFSIGTGTSYTLPSLIYTDSKTAFVSSYPLRTEGDTAYSILNKNTIDVFHNDYGTNGLNASLQYDCLMFSNKWRLRYDDVNDQMKLERYNSDLTTWENKFVFSN